MKPQKAQEKKKKRECDIRVTPQIKVGEIFVCEGNFFYLTKGEYKRMKYTTNPTVYERYFLRVVLKKDKVDKMLNIIEGGQKTR